MALEMLRQGDLTSSSATSTCRASGYELLQQIRADAMLQSLPVLLVTSEANKDDVLQAIRLGANGTILKPLTKSSLEEKVRNILLRSSAWPSSPAPRTPAASPSKPACRASCPTQRRAAPEPAPPEVAGRADQSGMPKYRMRPVRFSSAAMSSSTASGPALDGLSSCHVWLAPTMAP